MKLWYTRSEIPEAQKEAEEIISRINKEIPLYFRGNVMFRMAWRVGTRAREVVPLEEWKMYGKDSLPAYIPEAELLFNGEVVMRDLLDLILIDINRLEMKAIMQSMKDTILT